MGSAVASFSVAVVFMIAAGADSSADSTRGPVSSAVVLLQNGELLRGKVTRRGQIYTVDLSESGEVRIAAAEVKFVGRDMQQVYRFLRSRTDLKDVASLLQLSRWCLAQRMLSEAADAVLRAMAISPHDPEVARMEQRLRLAARQPQRDALPAGSSQGVVAPEDEDDTRRALPRGAIAEFASVVQPLLVNRCATAGCHGPRPASKFQLQRLSSSRLLRRRTTLDNLDATLAMTGGPGTESSPLLRMAKAPHGTESPSTLRLLNEAQYRQLESWVAQVVGDRPDTSQSLSQESDGAQAHVETEPEPVLTERPRGHGSK